MKLTIRLVGLAAMVLAVARPAWAQAPADPSAAPAKVASAPSSAPVAVPPALAPAMKYATDATVGIVHVSVKELAKPVLAALAKDPEFQGLDANTLAAIGRFAERIDSLDLYLAAGENMPVQHVIVRGPLAAQDVKAVLSLLTGDDGDVLKKLDEKGRYTLGEGGPPFEFVFGGESNDLPAGVVAIGLDRMVTPSALAALGRGNRADLVQLASGEAAAAPIWLAVLADQFDIGEGAPRAVAGSVFLLGGGASKLRLDFADANAASAALADMEAASRAGDFISRALVEIMPPVRDGSAVMSAAKGQDSLVPAALKALAGARRAARKAASAGVLHSMGARIIVWSADHDDVMPGDLMTLVKDGAMSAETLVSPVSDRTLQVDANGMPVGEFDYVLVKYPVVLNKIKNADKMVLAYERLANYKGEGTQVLFVDGHVQWMKADDFAKQLKATEDWIAAQEKTATTREAGKP